MSWIVLAAAIGLLVLYSKSRNAVWGGATLGAIVGVLIAALRPGFDWWTVGWAVSIGTFSGALSEWAPRLISIIEARGRAKSQDKYGDSKIDELKSELEQKKRELQTLEDPETICSFGQMAYDGDGVEQSYVEAASWYRIAADAGNARAQHNLSLMYENGEGVEKDDPEAVRWCKAAANQGHAGSQNNLGVRHETGQGVPKDLLEAFRWYKRAAAGGDLNGQSNLGRIPQDIRDQLE